MLSDFFKGVAAYSRALGLISELRLWKYLLLPGLLGIGVGLVIVGAAWSFYDDLSALILSWLDFSSSGFFHTFSNVISALAILALGIILYKHLLMVIVSPFMSPLAQRVEEHLTGKAGAYYGFSASQAIKDLLRGLRIALRNLFRELLFTLPLLLLSFLPVVGIVGAIALFLVQAFYAGFGNMDYTLERHFSVRESVRFVRENRWLAVGNGSIFMLLLSTGIGVFVAPPLATVAASIETVKRLELHAEMPFRQEYV